MVIMLCPMLQLMHTVNHRLKKERGALTKCFQSMEPTLVRPMECRSLVSHQNLMQVKVRRFFPFSPVAYVYAVECNFSYLLSAMMFQMSCSAKIIIRARPSLRRPMLLIVHPVLLSHQVCIHALLLTQRVFGLLKVTIGYSSFSAHCLFIRVVLLI